MKTQSYSQHQRKRTTSDCADLTVAVVSVYEFGISAGVASRGPVEAQSSEAASALGLMPHHSLAADPAIYR